MGKGTPAKVSRRKFLIMTTASGITVLSGATLFDLRPWLDYDGPAKRSRTILLDSDDLQAQMRKIVHYATLAASSHNSQPWKFTVKQKTIEIHPDYSRRLPVVDPNDRELWMSLGCALENLIIGASATGFSCHVTYPDSADYIAVSLTDDTAVSSALVDAIALRQNTRSAYDGKKVPSKDVDQLQSIPLEPGIGLSWILDDSVLKTTADYVGQGNLIQWADHAFVDELISWLRFNKREALDTYDGLFTSCSGNPVLPGWLGRLFVSKAKPSNQSEADVSKLLGSSGAVVITSTSEDRTQWVRTGQVYERLALKMTSLNIKSALLNQPIETTSLRPQLQSALGLGKSAPELLLRFGYAASTPVSLRRPVEQVLFEA